MSWPVQSADLNPIELVWDELVRAKQATGAAHLWQHLQQIWKELYSVYLQSLVDRISRIYEEVVEAKEDHFNKSKV